MARIRTTTRKILHARLGAPTPSERASRLYRLRHGVPHLHAATLSPRAVALLCDVGSYLERFELPSPQEAVQTLARDLALTAKSTTDDRLAPWRIWLDDHAALFEEAPTLDDAHSMVLQTAVEHADDSPVTESASRWFDLQGAARWHFRDPHRPESWRAPRAYVASWRLGAPLADGTAAAAFGDDVVLCLRVDGRLEGMRLRSRRRLVSERDDLVAVAKASPRHAITLARNGEVSIWSPHNLREQRLARCPLGAGVLATVGNFALIAGAGLTRVCLRTGELTDFQEFALAEPCHVATVGARYAVIGSDSGLVALNVGKGAFTARHSRRDARLAQMVALDDERVLLLWRKGAKRTAQSDEVEGEEPKACIWEVWNVAHGVIEGEPRNLTAKDAPDRVAARCAGGVWVARRRRIEAWSSFGEPLADAESFGTDNTVQELLEQADETPVYLQRNSLHAYVAGAELPPHSAPVVGIALTDEAFISWDDSGTVRVWSPEAKRAALPPEPACNGRAAAVVAKMGLDFGDSDLKQLETFTAQHEPRGCSLQVTAPDSAPRTLRWWSGIPMTPFALNPDGTLGIDATEVGAVASRELQLFRGNTPMFLDDLADAFGSPRLEMDAAHRRMAADVAARHVFSGERARSVLRTMTPREERVLRMRVGVEIDDLGPRLSGDVELVATGRAKLTYTRSLQQRASGDTEGRNASLANAIALQRTLWHASPASLPHAVTLMTFLYEACLNDLDCDDDASAIERLVEAVDAGRRSARANELLRAKPNAENAENASIRERIRAIEKKALAHLKPGQLGFTEDDLAELRASTSKNTPLPESLPASLAHNLAVASSELTRIARRLERSDDATPQDWDDRASVAKAWALFETSAHAREAALRAAPERPEYRLAWASTLGQLALLEQSLDHLDDAARALDEAITALEPMLEGTHRVDRVQTLFATVLASAAQLAAARDDDEALARIVTRAVEHHRNTNGFSITPDQAGNLADVIDLQVSQEGFAVARLDDIETWARLAVDLAGIVCDANPDDGAARELHERTTATLGRIVARRGPAGSKCVQ